MIWHKELGSECETCFYPSCDVPFFLSGRVLEVGMAGYQSIGDNVILMICYKCSPHLRCCMLTETSIRP